jgi:NADPH2:quinone reductase
MTTTPPSTMRAVTLHSYEDGAESIALEDRPVPRPGDGQVLVRIEAAPINPSDLAFIAGGYGLTKELPVVPGFEGSGTVVSAGGGAHAHDLLGKRVACGVPPDGDGTWASYLVTSADRCMPLLKETSTEQGATLIINPLTASALMEIAEQGGHRAVVQTAAAGALGQMILRLGQRRSVPVIHVVRRDEQVDMLHSMGAEHVLNGSEKGFEDELRDLSHKLNATIAFDAVAGRMTFALARAMPKGSHVIVYGGLSGKPCLLDPMGLVFEGKSVGGFWLADWLPSQSPEAALRLSTRVQGMLGDDLRTEIRARVPLEGALDALAEYASNMTGGKVLIIPTVPASSPA